MNNLRDTLEHFSQLQDDPKRWQWEKGQNLSAYLEQLPSSEPYKRKVRSVQRQVMQAQRGSSYEADASEHHALKAASYARFSSPMREVVGVFTHKELLEALGGEAIENHIDETLRDSVIEAAMMARTKQRKLDKKIALAALHQQFSTELASSDFKLYSGTIMGMRKDRLYITLDENALDIKIYKDDLDTVLKCSYTIEAAEATPTSQDKPSWQLGDHVHVKLIRYDNERSRFVFSLSKPQTIN